MTDFHQNGNGSTLDAFLDGTLAEQERAAWLVRLRGDAGLRAQVRRQEMIDESLRRMFAPDESSAVACVARVREAAGLAVDGRAGRMEAAAVTSRRGRTVLALAAALGLCVVAGWQVHEFLTPAAKPVVYATQAWRSVDRVYADEVAGGFKPAWVCASDAKFAEATQRELGQPVLLAQAPGVAGLGWSYANTLSPSTLYLLATAGDVRVLVFMKPAHQTAVPVVEPDSGLFLHERKVGEVVLYEVSPKDTPLVLPHFYRP